jgi:hypothetical protein
VEGRVMPQFSPDQVTFGDMPGYGVWDDSHFREHLQFVQALAQQSPPTILPDFDLLRMLTAGPARQSAIQSHQSAHDLLNQALGLTAVDLAEFNFDDENDFYNFLGYNSQNHAAIRTALGITS